MLGRKSSTLCFQAYRFIRVLNRLNECNRVASFGAELPNNRHCRTGMDLGILRNKRSGFYQRSCGDDTICRITGEIVAQPSSLDCDQRG
jgi:hypothetical protein